MATESASSGNALDATVVISRSYLEHLLRTSLNETKTEEHSVRANDNQPGVPTIPQRLGYAQTEITQTSLVDGTSRVVPWAMGATARAVAAPTTAATSVGPQARTTRARKQESPVEYFPFGRPGCGAPLRTDSGQVMADLRQRTGLQGHDTLPRHSSNVAQEPPPLLPSLQQPAPSQSASEGGGQVRQSAEMASPRYARGAGPHVNQYVLKDKEEKRKKQLEHVVSLISIIITTQWIMQGV